MGSRTELRALQAPEGPLKKSRMPALVALKAKGVLNEIITCKVENAPRHHAGQGLRPGDRWLGA